ncbi:MAG TPA: hypothetical protein VF533_12200 [Solirubrobacteraceae bacterium]|jgi:hypothetical protein
MVRAWTTAACLVALLAATATARAQVRVGVSEQTPAALTDPWLAQVPIGHARLITRWDAALRARAPVDAWLAQARAAGLVPMVALSARPGDRCPGSPCLLPSLDDYRAAVRAFRKRWPEVRELTPWNEANHPGQPTAGAPERAAEYYRVVRDECDGCAVVAADVLDSSSMEQWLTAFRATLGGVPRLWGLHNYADVNRFGSDRTDAFLGAVPGDVWLTETGGLVYLRDEHGHDAWTRDVDRAARAVDHLFDVVQARPRIGRAYLYQWVERPGEDFDSAIIDAGGTPRPAFDVVRRRLAALAGGGEPGPAGGPSPGGPEAPLTGGDVPPAPPAPPARPRPRRMRADVGAVRLARRGDVRVALACAAAGRRCRGTVRVRSRGTRWARGRVRLAPGSARWVRLRRLGTRRARPGRRAVVTVRLGGRRVVEHRTLRRARRL